MDAERAIEFLLKSQARVDASLPEPTICSGFVANLERLPPKPPCAIPDKCLIQRCRFGADHVAQKQMIWAASA